jgi:transposase
LCATNLFPLEDDMTKLPIIDAPAAPAEHATMYVAFELSKAKWKIGIVLPGGQKMSRFTLTGGDTAALAELLARKRGEAAARWGGPVRVISCYEAGYDGFWLHRWLAQQGVENRVLDPASIEVERRKRRVKTDRIDLEKLMRVLLALCRGEPRVCSLARPPSVPAEDAKRRHRERERLIKERGAHINRIKALLHGQGIRELNPLAKRFLPALGERRTGDGRDLPPILAREIAREHARLLLVVAQIAAVEAETRTSLQAPPVGSSAAKTVQLARLKGIGETTAQVLANEVYYRDFANRRQVGGFVGLTGTPYDSGQTRREQGISKAGNPRARASLIELAWFWLVHQPDSELTRWFKARVGDLKGRVRKIAIVALARKLAVALWRYLETGLVPEGAVLKAAPQA